MKRCLLGWPQASAKNIRVKHSDSIIHVQCQHVVSVVPCPICVLFVGMSKIPKHQTHQGCML